MEGFLIYIVLFVVALSFYSASKKNIKNARPINTEELDEQIPQ